MANRNNVPGDRIKLDKNAAGAIDAYWEYSRLLLSIDLFDLRF